MKVLLCEDICGEGTTLSDCRDYLRGFGLDVQILTAGYDDKSALRPDYGLDGRGYSLLFPWERHSQTERYRLRWATTQGGRLGVMEEDHLFDQYAIDLDGILMPDIALSEYESCLYEALKKRDRMDSHADLPLSDRINAIITGRPEADRGRTKMWLEQHGFEGVELVMRNSATHDDSPSQVADHKTRAILERACTHFIESDPVQALLIAAAAPLLRIIWWDASTKTARLVGADPVEGFRLNSF